MVLNYLIRLIVLKMRIMTQRLLRRLSLMVIKWQIINIKKKAGESPAFLN